MGRQVPRDMSTQASDTAEWTKLDIGRCLQLLRSDNPGVVRRTLRMLHVRWWHVPQKRFENILSAAGAPGAVINMIPDIVDTCRACRMWQKPDPKSAVTARLVEAFNEVARHDLMFASPHPGQHAHTKLDKRTEPWQHLIDTCNRLSQATIINNKTTPELIRPFEMAWLRPFGPPRV